MPRDVRRAIALWRQALDVDPNNVYAQSHLGRALMTHTELAQDDDDDDADASSVDDGELVRGFVVVRSIDLPHRSVCRSTTDASSLSCAKRSLF